MADKLKVRVTAYKGLIVIDVDEPREGIGDYWYPTGQGRMGCVVFDSRNRVGVSKEAIELMSTIRRNHDAIGDLGWFGSDNHGYCFSWWGPIYRVVDQTAEGDRGFFVRPGEYVEIPNDVPPDARAMLDIEPAVVAWRRDPISIEA